MNDGIRALTTSLNGARKVVAEAVPSIPFMLEFS